MNGQQMSSVENSSHEHKEEFLNGQRVEEKAGTKALLPTESEHETSSESNVSALNPLQQEPPKKKARVDQPPKRQYVHVAPEQRKELADLFQEYGDSQPSEWYHSQTGIPLRNCQNLITKLRKGIVITRERVRRGRPKILTPEHCALIAQAFEGKSQTTLHQLVNRVTQYEEQKAEAQEELECEESQGDVSRNQDGIGKESSGIEEDGNDDGSETEPEIIESVVSKPKASKPKATTSQKSLVHDKKKALDQRPICSVSTMCRFLKSHNIIHGPKARAVKSVSRSSCHGNEPQASGVPEKVAEVVATQKSEENKEL